MKCDVFIFTRQRKYVIQARWTFLSCMCKMFPPVYNGAKKIKKNRSRFSRVMITNVLPPFYGSQCIQATLKITSTDDADDDEIAKNINPLVGGFKHHYTGHYVTVKQFIFKEIIGFKRQKESEVVPEARGPTGHRVSLISVSLSLSQTPAYLVRPRMADKGAVCVCLFTPQLLLVLFHRA